MSSILIFFSIRGLNSDQLGVLEKKHYSVDENTERRNHYLDLAGIENYASRFEGDGLTFILCFSARYLS